MTGTGGYLSMIDIDLLDQQLEAALSAELRSQLKPAATAPEGARLGLPRPGRARSSWPAESDIWLVDEASWAVDPDPWPAHPDIWAGRADAWPAEPEHQPESSAIARTEAGPPPESSELVHATAERTPPPT